MIKISTRTQKIKQSGIREYLELASQIRNPINLSIGEPHFDMPRAVKQALIKAINAGKNKYSPTAGILELRKRVARKLQVENNIRNVAVDNILITAGTSGAIFLGLSALLNSEDEVLIPDPHFALYEAIVEFLGAKPIFIDTYPDFNLTADKIEKKITPKTKILIINSPNNPTGKMINVDEIKKIVVLCKKYHIFVISDEIYEKFSYDLPHKSIGEFYDDVLVVNGFSKSYSMTGSRVGYACGPVELIREMTKLQQYTFVCAPTAVQYAAIKAFDVDISKRVTVYKSQSVEAYSFLKNAGFEVEKVQGGFYLFPRLPINITATEFSRQLIEKKTLVIPGRAFSIKDSHFRISISVPRNTLKVGLKNIIEQVQRFF